MLRLRTIGRRSGEERSAILGYYEDGPDLVTLAMNGWAEGEPAWWLNLQACPDATVDLVDGPRTVTARAAAGDERARLWAGWRDVGDDVDAYAPLRSSETAVVVLAPRSDHSQTLMAGGPAPDTGEAMMDTNRSNAVAAGVALLVATIAQLIGVALVSPIISNPVDLTKISADQSQVILGAFFQFIGALACPAIALALYPVLRRYNEGLALGSVGFRLIEGTLHVLIAVCLLLLVSLSQEIATAGAGSAAFQAQSALLMAGREWLGPLSVLAFGLGGFMYYWVFYRSRIVPRWLSIWGLVAIPLVMLSALLVMFQGIENFSTTQLVLAFPIFVQEMVLAAWLIAKGFNPSAVAPESAGETSRWRATASTASG